MQTYKVGGAVRDRLLGLPVSDTDWVVVGSTPEQMLKQGYQQVGRDFPVFLHPDTHEEYALARTERKSGKGYTGFEVHASPDVTLEQDLQRRDLTINAMAETEEGQLIDPYGGQQDLEARLLRHVSTAFSEDPLRVLRVARFAARFADKGFSIAAETLELMKAISHSGELSALVAERIWQETSRALGENRPDVYFQTLHDCSALDEILPEAAALFKTTKKEEMLNALRRSVNLSQSVPVRFASLLHPLDMNAARSVCMRIKAPVVCSDLTQLVVQHLRHYQDMRQPSAPGVMALLERTDAFRRSERFHDFLMCCQAISGDEPQWKQVSAILEKALDSALDVSAGPLMEKGFKGPELGAALQKARLAALAATIEQEG